MSMPSIRQRFAKNISKRPDMTGYGKSAFRSKGFTFPSHSQMNQFSKFGIIYDVDPDIRDLVIDTNRAGYTTWGSCQGHIKGQSGYVSLKLNKQEIPHKFLVDNPKLNQYFITEGGYSKKPVNVQEIKEILKKHGLIFTRYIPPSFSKGGKGSGRLHHAFLFRPVLDKTERK